MDARALALVFTGGALGSLARALLAQALPGGWLPTVNLLGSLLLGLLYGALATGSLGAATRWRQLLGTGFLGGFTTYSAFAAQEVLSAGGDPTRAALGLIAAAASVAAGVALALLGLWLGGRVGSVARRGTSGSRERDASSGRGVSPGDAP